MDNLSQLLLDIKAALITIPDFQTVGIGEETGMTSPDCPAARIVLNTSISTQPQIFFDNGDLEIRTYLDTKNDMEKGYLQSIDLQYKVREAVEHLLLYNLTTYNTYIDMPFFTSSISFNFSGVRNQRDSECPDPLGA